MKQLKAMMDDMKAIKTSVEDVKDIKNSVSKMEDKFDLFNVEVERLKAENESFKVKFEDVSKQNRELRLVINDLEQYSRIDNVVINGIPSTEEENIRETVLNIAKNLEVNLSGYEINTAHCLRTNQDKIAPIIVRLNNRNKKQELIRNSKQMRLHGKNLNMNPAMPIYVNEHLSPYTMSVFKNAIDLRNQGVLSHVWVREGNIFIRENENCPSRKIKDIEDLPILHEANNLDNHVDGTDQQLLQQAKSSKTGNQGPLTLSQISLRSKRRRRQSKNYNKT